MRYALLAAVRAAMLAAPPRFRRCRCLRHADDLLLLRCCRYLRRYAAICYDDAYAPCDTPFRRRDIFLAADAALL